MIRRACALAGLLALFLQGSSGGHMLLVEHTRCAEHGALVHGGEAHHHGAEAHAETHTQAFENASNERSDVGHGHCALTADRRDALIAVVDAQVSTLIEDTQEDFARSGIIVASDGSRFRVAPKNSPPA